MQVLTRATTPREIREVRLVGEGVNKLVSIDEAFRAAEEEGLDLVCVSDQTLPLVVRIQDFKKLEYEKKKSRKAQKAKGRTSELKEIQLKMNISDHDLETKMNKIRVFLDRGDKVKIMVRLRGRERQDPFRAKKLIDRVVAGVGCKVSASAGPVTMAILESNKPVAT